MLFNSFDFLFVFLPLCLAVYFVTLQFSFRAAMGALILFSVGFYSYWEIDFLWILLASILVNYVVGFYAVKHSNRRRKQLIFLGIFFNVALLFYFKYRGFFLENLSQVLGYEISYIRYALPLGISFFTFQQLAYLVDIYYSRLEPPPFYKYCLFVTFFPQLIAGPIVHHAEVMPQFEATNNKSSRRENFALGIVMFAGGLFKKVVIADHFAQYAIAGFASPASLDQIGAWIASLSYTIQLYFDFSGYSDMAIGLGLFFNIALPINFHSPYKALDIQDFWRRWHITLSRFLRDYVYIPLGGNRSSKFKLYRNLYLTFLIGGIWHGAGWTFIVWGSLHGIALMIHRAWSKELGMKLPKLLGWILTFSFVNMAWVFFRAGSIDDATIILSKMFLFNMTDWNSVASAVSSRSTELLLVLALVLVASCSKNIFELSNFWSRRLAGAPIIAFITFVAVLSLDKISEFLYFDF